jgi:ribosomal protein S18 acetylase RimI-like enzyme
MLNDAIHIRPAMKSEARTIAKLFLISSEGLAAYVWQKLAQPDELLLAVGARRYAREDIPCSYRNCLVAERAGRVIGMAHCVPLGADLPDCYIPGVPDDDVLRPYRDLCYPESLFVTGLAVFPAARRQGIGSRLLAAVRERARSLGYERLSLICFEPNEGACRLYRQHGFTEVARRALVPHPLLHYAEGDALLMAAPVEAEAAQEAPEDLRPFSAAASVSSPLHSCGQPLDACQCS